MNICITGKLCTLAAAAVVVGVMGGSLNVGAEVVEILYDSFESPDISGSTGDTPPGWIKENTSSGMWDEDWGGGWVSTPYGTQGIRCWTGSGFKTSAITDVLQPMTTYTLTFNVGNVNPDTGAPRTDNQYTAYLMAGTNVLGSVSATTTTDDMSETNVVSVTTTAAPPALGETLAVRLAMSGGNFHAQSLFDNVRLVAEESPEWARTLFYGK